MLLLTVLHINTGRARITTLLLNHLHNYSIFKLYLFTIYRQEEDEYPIPKDVTRIIIYRNNSNYLVNKIRENDIGIFIYQLEYYTEIQKLSKLKWIKVIFYLHSSIFYYFYTNQVDKYKKLYKAYKNCKYIVNLIHLENDFLFRKWKINSIFINNFVTYEYNSIIPSDLSSQNIIMIGRNDKIKRYQLGILSMKYIVNSIPNSIMKLIIPNYDFSLSDLIHILKLENNIELLEYAKNPEIFFKNASLHFFLSTCESFGLVLSEAKIFGVPSIILGLDYISIWKGGTVIIYDDSPAKIAKEAIYILSNKKYRKRLGIEARKSMKNLTNENIGKRWIKLILSINKGDKYYKKLRENKSYIELSPKKYFKIYKNQFNLLKKRIDYFHNFSFEDFDKFIEI